LASIGNISGLNLQAGANAAPVKGLSASKDGLLAFLNLLMGNTADAAAPQGGGDLAAKLAAVLKNDPSDKTQLASLLQKLFPDAGADTIQQAIDQIEAAPSGDIQASLTSDLSASLATDLQGDSDAMATLKAKLDAMIQDGPITPDKMAHFRKEAIDTLKADGCDAASINDFLVSLATDLGDKLTTPLAAQLGMPVPSQAAATAQATTTVSDDASDDTDNTGLVSGADFSLQQLVSTEPEAGDTEAPAAPKAAPDVKPQGTPAADTGVQGLLPQQAAPQATDATAKPLPPSAAHLFVMEQAQNDGGTFNSDGGQFANTSGGSPVSLTGMMHADGAASPQSFVNYMTSASASAPAQPTVQNVAVQIAQNANNGITTFTMQLEPAELGRLEVRMKFDRDGGIKAHLIAEKPETLSLLQNDQAQINRILQQAGLDTDGNTLSFDLRQQNQQQGTEQSYNGAGQSSDVSAAATANDFISAKLAVEAMGYIRQDGVNIMV
jgi:chemotaxis protein MotD